MSDPDEIPCGNGPRERSHANEIRAALSESRLHVLGLDTNRHYGERTNEKRKEEGGSHARAECREEPGGPLLLPSGDEIAVA